MVGCIGFEFKFSLNSNSFESVWKRKGERKLEIEKEDPNLSPNPQPSFPMAQFSSATAQHFPAHSFPSLAAQSARSQPARVASLLGPFHCARSSSSARAHDRSHTRTPAPAQACSRTARPSPASAHPLTPRPSPAPTRALSLTSQARQSAPSSSSAGASASPAVRSHPPDPD